MVRSLAAALQMLDQTALNVAFDLTVRAHGVSQGEVVRPSFQMSVQLANQDRNRLEALLTVRHLMQLYPLPLDGLWRRKHIQVFSVPAFPVSVIPKRVP